MDLGLSSKNKRGASVHVDYLIHIQEVKPWPPSQSLRSLRSVVIQWENGERNSGSTKIVSPTLGSIIGEGKIEFGERFKLPVTLLRDMSARAKDGEAFQKNVLEFNLYETRRDKTQLLATASIDLADYGNSSEALSLTTPMNCKRSFRNNTQPMLFLAIQPVDKRHNSSSSRNAGPLSKEASLDKNGSESVSTLMSDEYASEAEIASFTDDDVSSHSSLTASSSNLESSVKRSKESTNAVPEIEPSESQKRSSSKSSSADLSSDFGSLATNHVSTFGTSDAICVPEQEVYTTMRNNVQGDSVDGSQGKVPSKTMQNRGDKSQTKDVQIGAVYSKTHTTLYTGDDPENVSSQSAERNQVSIHDYGVKTDTEQVERLKTVRSVRSSSDIGRSNGVSGGSVSFQRNERKDIEFRPKDTGNATLENKVRLLEGRIKMLEGELRETAAIEASLYSVVSEHGSSAGKVHAPARRLSRLYLHACGERPPSRKAATAKSIVSGLLLVAKSCGNDVPRLTYWLSNCIVLRTIVSQVNGEPDQPVSTGLHAHKQNSGRKKKELLSEGNAFSPNRNGDKDIMYEGRGDWDDLHTLTWALKKAEAWTFSRIVESIWWQTLTPCMQSAAAKAFNQANGPASKKNFGRTPSSVDQEQGNFSLELWKKAFKDSWERLCPVRAGGHECGCLPMLARLIMEQCVARLDVAMFNAVLRDSDDEIPTDPVSDPIGDLKVLPILAGKSSFGSGAQLKNAIGSWSRWLTDLFGIDDDDAIIGEEDNPDEGSGDYRGDTSFKSFYLLNALSDLMMLPKDMLLNSSIRKEVCPTFGAPLIKRILYNFVPDEFCPDPIPNSVLEALESEEADEAQEESIADYPCTAAPPVYSPPSVASVAGIIGGSGSHSQLWRSGSPVVRKSYTSDDELDELNSALDLILMDGSQPSPLPTKPGFLQNSKGCPNAVRYELLRGIWRNSE